MATTHKFYGKFWVSMANKEVDFNSDVIKGLLVTSTYTFNQDTHQYKDVSITNELPTAGGYTAGGLAIPSPAFAYDSGSKQTRFTGSNISWGSSTFTARGLAVYDDTPGSNKPLVSFVDFGQDLSPVNGTLAITWDALGLAYVQVS